MDLSPSRAKDEGYIDININGLPDVLDGLRSSTPACCGLGDSQSRKPPLQRESCESQLKNTPRWWDSLRRAACGIILDPNESCIVFSANENIACRLPLERRRCAHWNLTHSCGWLSRAEWSTTTLEPAKGLDRLRIQQHQCLFKAIRLHEMLFSLPFH